MKFELRFKKPIIVKADSLEQAFAKVDGGEVVRMGFKTTMNGVQYDFYELPDFELIPQDKTPQALSEAQKK